MSFGVIRLALNLIFSVINSARTVLWLAMVLSVLGYGYLVFNNGLDVVAAFHEIAAIIVDLWYWFQGVYAELTNGITGFAGVWWLLAPLS